MLPSGSWLHLVIGCVFGISSTIFVSKVQSLWRDNYSDNRLIRTTVLYILSVVVISFLYASALSGGLLIEWKLLGFPRLGDPATKVLDIGYVQGKSGNIYKDNQGTWEQADVIAHNEDEYDLTPTAGNCGTLLFMPIHKRDFIDSKSACIGIGPGLAIAKTVYAIDSGGRVYSWRHGAGEFSGIEKLYFPVCGAGVSFIFSVVVISIVDRQHRKREAIRSESLLVKTSA